MSGMSPAEEIIRKELTKTNAEVTRVRNNLTRLRTEVDSAALEMEIYQERAEGLEGALRLIGAEA